LVVQQNHQEKTNSKHLSTLHPIPTLTEMASYLITGSSRGIGLGYVTILARKDASEVGKIFAAARSENSALKRLISESAGRIEFVPLEVTSEESAVKVAQHVERSLGGKGLDILINNAGVPSHTEGGIENMCVIESWGIIYTLCTDDLLGQILLKC
jgi:NAD(P)-dependent dehydrogenase (short-subunit alcohol dehydrogenase family)